MFQCGYSCCLQMRTGVKSMMWGSVVVQKDDCALPSKPLSPHTGQFLSKVTKNFCVSVSVDRFLCVLVMDASCIVEESGQHHLFGRPPTQGFLGALLLRTNPHHVVLLQMGFVAVHPALIAGDDVPEEKGFCRKTSQIVLCSLEPALFLAITQNSWNEVGGDLVKLEFFGDNAVSGIHTDAAEKCNFPDRAMGILSQEATHAVDLALGACKMWAAWACLVQT